MPERQGRCVDGAGAERVQQQRDPQDVHDRVRGAYFVKMHIPDGHPVGDGLGLGYTLEGFEGARPCTLGHRGAPDEPRDIGPMAMGLRL